MQATFSRSKVDVAAVHLDTPAPFGRRILDLPALDALDGSVSVTTSGTVIQRTHMAHLFLKPKPFDLFLHQVHAWSGWLIMALALSQLILRFTYGRPPPIQGMSVLERMIAGVTHAVLYGLLLALPITGTIAMYVTFRIASLHSLLSWMLLVRCDHSRPRCSVASLLASRRRAAANDQEHEIARRTVSPRVNSI